MLKMLVIFLVKFLIFAKIISAQNDNNKMWILIDNADLLVCSGPPNQFTLTKEDVSVRDKSGQPVQILEAPGEYFIQFNNIKVKKALPNISGRLAALLQVPLVSAGFVNFDLPYPIIPQSTLVEGYKCDNESGHIFDRADNRHYCLYCNLCSTSSHVEKKISTDELGVPYSPNLASEGSFDSVCQQISAETYSLKRSVNIPDKKELEREANERYKSSLEGPVLQKLKLGKGKLQVFLNLDSNTQPPVDANKWYGNNRSCSCCAKDSAGNSNCRASGIEILLGRKSQRCIVCNNDYVKSCLQGTGQRVGCFVVQYNFHVTDNRTEYELFKAKLDRLNGGSVPSTLVSSGGGSGAGQAQPCNQCNAQACINVIQRSEIKRFCSNNFSRSFCCRQCSSVCLSPDRKQVF